MSNQGRVFVAGHRGLVGSAIVRGLRVAGRDDPLTVGRETLDLTDGPAVSRWFAQHRPRVVIVAAARVGGIRANDSHPWGFLYDNLAIQNSMLSAALESEVERLIFLGSSCIYPRNAPQPIKEAYLLTGPLEPTNEPYALAKIAGIKLVEAANREHGRSWVSLMPTNLYGPNDNFDLETSHVLPAMIRKFHDAKMRRDAGEEARVTLWGTGSALREFLHVDDMASATIHMIDRTDTGWINVGYGEDVSIRELAEAVAETVGYDGPVEWDRTKPDGTPRKLLDSSLMRETGWAPSIDLRSGLRSAYQWFREHRDARGLS